MLEDLLGVDEVKPSLRNVAPFDDVYSHRARILDSRRRELRAGDLAAERSGHARPLAPSQAEIKHTNRMGAESKILHQKLHLFGPVPKVVEIVLLLQPLFL